MDAGLATGPDANVSACDAGAVDCDDACPADDGKVSPGICGCGAVDADGDLDGTLDCKDACPGDRDKTAPGLCGCGLPDTDGDDDGTVDCKDACPGDGNKTAPGLCGCGVPEPASGQASDCRDACPEDPSKTAPGVCGCGVAEVDGDGDGTLDCVDECPETGALSARGTCGCQTLSPRGDYCGGDLPRLTGMPVIDGHVECGLPLQTLTPLGWDGPRGVPLPQGNQARFAIAWHPDGIYFFVEVDDPDRTPNTDGLPHCGDSVELYVDSAGRLSDLYTRPGTIAVVVQAPSGDDAPARRAGLFAFTPTGANRDNWNELQNFGAFPRAAGYSVEALVTKAALGLSNLSLAAGADVGVSVSINVSDSTGLHGGDLPLCEDRARSRRLGQYYLSLAPKENDSLTLCGGGQPWCTEKAFCVDSLLP